MTTPWDDRFVWLQKGGTRPRSPYFHAQNANVDAIDSVWQLTELFAGNALEKLLKQLGKCLPHPHAKPHKLADYVLADLWVDPPKPDSLGF